ncbi:MAG: DNRLRE domain-containing protein [Acidobacteriota bacterium]
MSYRWTVRTLLVFALAMLGTGAASASPNLFVVPNVTTIDIGTTTVGTPITRSIYLYNAGTSDLYVYDVTTTGDFTPVNPPNRFHPIPPGFGVYMQVRLDATSVGAKTGFIDYVTNDLYNVGQGLKGLVENGTPPLQTIMVQANADSMVRQGSPSTNFGSSHTLGIRRPSSGLGRYSFLRFTVPAFSGTVQSAVLRIRTKSTTINQAQVYDVNMGWSESTITWNNWLSGGTTFSFLRDTGTLAANQWHEIDVTEAIPAGGGTVTIGLATMLDLTLLQFHSRESSFKPSLEIVMQ